MKVILILIAIYAIIILLMVIRMAIDPKYRDKVEKEAYRYRNRHRHPRHVDPDDTDMFGNYIHPQLHERKERREYKKFLKSIK